MITNPIGRSKLLGTLAAIAVVLAACGGTAGSGSSYKEDGKALVFPTFNPFTGPDANFGP